MSGVISELSPPKTDVSFGVSINHLCEVECSALRLFLERVLPSRVLQRERRKVGNGSLFLGFSPSRVPLPTPIPTLRVAGYFQTDELNMFRCRSRLARRIPVTRVFPHRDACVYMYMCTCPLIPRSFFFLSSHASTRRGDVSPVCQGPSMCSARGIRSLNMNSPYGTLICIWATMTNPPTLSLPLPPTKSTARVSRAKTPPQREF